MQMSKNVMFVVVAVLVLIYLLPTIISAIIAAADVTGVDAAVTSIAPIVQIIAFVSPIGLLFMLWSVNRKSMN